MAKWKMTINIKPIIQADQGNESDERAAKVAKQADVLLAALDATEGE